VRPYLLDARAGEGRRVGIGSLRQDVEERDARVAAVQDPADVDQDPRGERRTVEGNEDLVEHGFLRGRRTAAAPEMPARAVPCRFLSRD
jgi:hypothetical protein